MCWCRIIRAGASRSGRNGCAARVTSPRSTIGCWPNLALQRRFAGRAGFRRLDRRGDGEPGADRVSQAGAGRRDGHQAAGRRHRRPGDRVVSRLSAGWVSTTAAAFARVYGDVSTDQLEAWDIAREMCFRTAWKPYMYSQTLPHLLGGVRTPALVVWGDDDRHRAEERRRCLCAGVAERDGWRSFRPAGTMWTWKSRTSWPSWCRRSSTRTEAKEADHASDVFHRTADGAPTTRRRGWTTARPR